MITFKGSVEVTKVSPVVFAIITSTHHVYTAAGVKELVVTSISDGEHMPTSKHYSGEAVDFRIWNIPEDKREGIFNALVAMLGDAYDCVWHKRSHFHIEYDPK